MLHRKAKNNLKKNAVIQILKTFDEEDTASFSKFLKSSLITRSNTLIDAYSFISNYAPDFDSSQMNKYKLYKKLKPDSSYNDEYIRNLMHKLLQVLLRFLMLKNYESRAEESHDFLRRELISRGLYDLAEKNITLSKEYFEKNSVDAEYYLTSFRFVSDIYNLKHFSNKFKGKKGLSERIDLISLRALDLISFFMIEILKTNYMLLNFTKNTGIDIQTNFARRFIESLNIWHLIHELKNTDEKRSKVFEMYYYLFLSFNDLKNESNFALLYKSIKKNGKIINKDELNFFYRRMIDYSIIKFRSKTRNAKFDKYLFELLDNFVHNKIYITSRSKFLPIQLFRNFIHFGIESKKYKWTEEIINTCRLKLAAEYRKNMCSYAFAMLFYERGLFQKASDEIYKIRRMDNFLFNLDAKTLMLKLDYETGNHEELITKCDTYRHYLKSSKSLSSERKIRLKNFVLILEKIIRLEKKCDARVVKNIKKELKLKKVESSDWLREKLKYYVNRYVTAV